MTGALHNNDTPGGEKVAAGRSPGFVGRQRSAELVEPIRQHAVQELLRARELVEPGAEGIDGLFDPGGEVVEPSRVAGAVLEDAQPPAGAEPGEGKPHGSGQGDTKP